MIEGSRSELSLQGKGLVETIGGYSITFDPLPSSLQQKLSKKEFAEYFILFERAQKKIKKKEAIALCQELENFYKHHSSFAEIANLLSYVYIRLKRIAAAEKLIEMTYAQHPDYLFGKLNYADLCLRRKKPEKVKEIFNHQFDLHFHYPQRKIFHFSEVRGFMTLMAHYHLQRKNHQETERYYALARQIDPLHYSVLFLEKKLFKVSLVKKLARIFKIG